jgi:putative two-component system response regulator
MTAHSQDTLLLVDDIPSNLKVLSSYLKNYDFKIRIARDGADALEQVLRMPPDLILLDIMMPEMDGFETCQRLKANEKTRDIPVIFMSALTEEVDKIKGLEIGAVDYITKPFLQGEVLARIKLHLSLRKLQNQVKQQNIVLEREVKKRTIELEQTHLQLICSLGRAAEFRDNETGMHVIRMSQCARRLAKAMKLSPEYCDLVLNASPMHDVGKIGIPDAILLKPGKLDPQEWEIMKTHTLIGEKILSGNNSELLKMAATLARSHHERWDGSGYPDGLIGESIPLISRITTICDVFDALLSKRPYKQAWSIEEAVAYLKAGSGTQFSPFLIDKFFNCLDDVLKIRAEYADE